MTPEEAADPGRSVAFVDSVLPVLDAGISGEEAHQTARRIAREAGLAEAGQVVLLVQGFNKDPQLEKPSITLLRA